MVACTSETSATSPTTTKELRSIIKRLTLVYVQEEEEEKT
jgi:hypothetical protein